MNRFQRRHNGATAFENLKGIVVQKKPLMQFGERCHWLEAERITHKYDPRWETGVWLGRPSASDAHLIGTPGGVIQVRTVRRLTREQHDDDVSKRAFDNFIGSPQNLSGSKPSLEKQTAHGEKWTLTPGCKGCIWARRGYHHTKACKSQETRVLVDQGTFGRTACRRGTTPGENLQVQQNLQVRRDLLDLHERKERNVNLCTSSLNLSPTWGASRWQ